MVAPPVLGEDPLVIEAITDRVIDRTMKFPGTFVCRARRVAMLAREFGLTCTPHAANRGMAQLFTLHLAAARPNCLYEPCPTDRAGALT